MIKVADVPKHFLDQADWIDREQTVDRVIIGDPEKQVDRCLVTWMPSFAAVRETVKQNIPLLVCHEPTFYNHGDDRPAAGEESPEIIAEKKAFIEQSGLAIVRLHDTWDRWPQVGIPWAWAQFLELPGQPAAFGHSTYQHRYDIDPVPLEDFARHVAARCATIGEPMVQVTGDAKQMVSKIGVGTGCGCGIDAYWEMGCDCSVVCDDGSCYWAGIQMSEDRDHPVIRVNHGTSEEPGMVTLTAWINEHLPLKATLLPHGSTFRLVGAQ